MRHLPPSLKALRAFEATARHLNVSRAAEELGVTQPAVTQHLRQLEDFLGVRLLNRGRTGVSLTEAGRTYATRLQRALAEINEATSEVVARERTGGVLTVALLGTLAQRWLIPRLPSFQAAFPDIEVRLFTTSRLVDLLREDVDIAIRFGDGAWPRCRSDYLMPNDTFPVASPGLLARSPLDRPSDLAEQVLLQVEAPPRTDDWRDWLDAAGCPGLESAGHLGFETSSHALEAAVAGLGVAIGHRPFVMDDLASGRLVAPFEITVPSDGAYHLVSAHSDADRHRIAAFRDWVLAQVA